MDAETLLAGIGRGEARAVARAISLVEGDHPAGPALLERLDRQRLEAALFLGVTGPPGAGKSTLTNGLVRGLRARGQRVGIIAIDPSSPLSGGALLGDRVRMMEHALDSEVLIRSMASRGRLGGLCSSAGAAARIMAGAGCGTVILETVGIGQSEMEVVGMSDLTLLVLAPGFGDGIQAMKAGILEVADLLVVNKADHPESERLLQDLGGLFPDAETRRQRLHATVASQGQGVDRLLNSLLERARDLEDSGRKQLRREQARRAETVSRALDLLQGRLDRLARQWLPEGRDPVLAARDLAAALLNDRENDQETREDAGPRGMAQR